MSLKAKLEAIIYATEEPVTLNELALLLKDSVLAEIRAEEEARLALNETISDGRASAESEAEEEFAIEEAAAEVADEPAMTISLPERDKPEPAAVPTKDEKKLEEKEQLKAVKAKLSALIDELTSDYAAADRGMEIRQVAGGYRMATKPEHHDVVSF